MGLDREQLIGLLERVRSGETGVAEAVEDLKYLPYQDIGSARIDHHRQLRSGVPEVVYCAGKTPSPGRGGFPRAGRPQCPGVGHPGAGARRPARSRPSFPKKYTPGRPGCST